MRLVHNAVTIQKTCIGVIAGTETDTRLGLNFLQSRSHYAIGLAISDTPQAQTQLQVLNNRQLTTIVLNKINYLVSQGASSCMLYCNSLSGAINLEAVKAKSKIPIVTPLDVYAELTKKYHNFGILAANCQSCANIEHIILSNNPTAKVIGIGHLQIVEDIEAGLSPDIIINLHSLSSLIHALAQSGIQIFIMACTHFDYFFDKLNPLVHGIKLYQPSERMLQLLLEQSKK